LRFSLRRALSLEVSPQLNFFNWPSICSSLFAAFSIFFFPPAVFTFPDFFFWFASA